jgi:hypothetical protein
MDPKIKSRPVGENPAFSGASPVLSPEVANPSASANAASRRRPIALQPASGAAGMLRDSKSS